MHVVTPGKQYKPLTYRLDEYGAYFRLLENGIGDFILSPNDSYPELVSHCDFCAWWSECEKRRRGDDHLCYVAGIKSTKIKNLRNMGIERLADLARLDEIPDPKQGIKRSAGTYA